MISEEEFKQKVNESARLRIVCECLKEIERLAGGEAVIKQLRLIGRLLGCGPMTEDPIEGFIRDKISAEVKLLKENLK